MFFKKKSFQLIFLYNLICIYCDNCEKEGDCSNKGKTIVNKYEKESNEIFQKIEDALSTYIPCNQTICTCNSKVLKMDLKPFRSGITQQMINNVRDRGTKYQIINHKLYRQRDCMFPARCSGVEYFIKKYLNDLSDLEMIINCRDWPQISMNWLDKSGPVLSFSKTNEYADIMYPTWGFREGGPAISLYPTGIGRWDLHRKSIKTFSDKNYPWKKKINKGFFRGSRTSSERDSLILLSRKNFELVDAQYTKNQAWKSSADTLGAEPAKEVSFEDHCKYKFLFNFRGVAASFRLKHLFLCKSLVFHVGDEWKEYFYDSLIPWVHYVPIKTNPTLNELQELITFFKENDDLAKEIADRGFNYIWKHLRMVDVECYWKTLLLKYSKLVNFKVVADENLIQI